MTAKKSLKPPKAAGRSNHFQTPDWPIDTILRYVPKHWKIWDPASGKGNIVARCRAAGYDAEGSDILAGFDFLSPLFPFADYDFHLTNPPYSLKDKWLERCFEIGKPFALLMPITALGEGGRFRLFRKHGVSLVMLPERVNYETPSGEGAGAWFYSAWFCHGLELPAQITFPD